MELQLVEGRHNPTQPDEDNSEPGAQAGHDQIRLGSIVMRQHGSKILTTFINPQPATYNQLIRDKFKARLPSLGWFHSRKPQKQVVSTGFAYAMQYSHETLLDALERNQPIPIRLDIDVEEPSPTLTQVFHNAKHHAPWPIHLYHNLEAVAHALRHEGLPVTIISWPISTRKHHS